MEKKVNGQRWFSIAMLLAGLLLGGTAGVIKGEWAGDKAAMRVKDDLEKDITNVKEEFLRIAKEIKEDIKELRRRSD